MDAAEVMAASAMAAAAGLEALVAAGWGWAAMEGSG